MLFWFTRLKPTASWSKYPDSVEGKR